MSTSSAQGQAPLEGRKLIFSGTAAHRGRAISVSPANSTLAYLHYGRIMLGPGRAARRLRDRGARDRAAGRCAAPARSPSTARATTSACTTRSTSRAGCASW